MTQRSRLLADDDAKGFYCELLGAPPPDGRPINGQIGTILRRLDRLNLTTLKRRARDAEREPFNPGITFTVHSEAQAIDRAQPVPARRPPRPEDSRGQGGAGQRIQVNVSLISTVMAGLRRP